MWSSKAGDKHSHSVNCPVGHLIVKCDKYTLEIHWEIHLKYIFGGPENAGMSKSFSDSRLAVQLFTLLFSLDIKMQ